MMMMENATTFDEGTDDWSAMGSTAAAQSAPAMMMQ